MKDYEQMINMFKVQRQIPSGTFGLHVPNLRGHYLSKREGFAMKTVKCVSWYFRVYILVWVFRRKLPTLFVHGRWENVFAVGERGTVHSRLAASVCQVRRDRQELDPTDSDMGCSRLLLSSRCDHSRYY